MSKRQLQISNFFAKKLKVDCDSKCSVSVNSNFTEPQEEDTSEVNVHKEAVANSEIVNIDVNDVGLYLNKNIENETKLNLLTTPWMPDNNFKFPLVSKRNLKFQLNWCKRFPWLVYTQAGNQGAVCKYCVVFANEVAGKGAHQMLEALVTKPFKKWKSAIEQFTSHGKNNYHVRSVVMGDNFVKVFTNTAKDIRNIINTGRQQEIAQNRRRLAPIIETIKLCGRQELALRGTSDSGPLDMTVGEPLVNDGNFRALLRMRISCGDEDLKNHFTNASRNALYISPHIQNEIIGICGSLIQNELSKKINNAKAFAVLADETTDISRKEQMSLCVRFVDGVDGNYSLREEFLSFVEIMDATGKNIAEMILKSLTALNINCDYLVGQGYDGAAAMRGSFKGVQSVVRRIHPAALYVHCSSHSLNLALCHASNVQHIRNCIGTVKSVGNFIKYSAKRTHILQTKIKAQLPESRWKKLTAMCETRWVENHDGLIRFKEVFVSIVETLEDLELVKDIETSSKAGQLLRSVTTPEFVVSLVSAEFLFKYTINLCKVLQTVNCDLSEALSYIDNIYTIQLMTLDLI